MKRLIYLSVTLVCMLACCQSSDTYSDLPRPIQQFVSQYWPNPDIVSYTHPSADVYTVTIRNGPSLTFDGDYSWTDIEGNGMPLPEVLAYDQLPAELYDYLESGSRLGEIFAMRRTPRLYTVELLDTSVEYTVGDHVITQR